MRWGMLGWGAGGGVVGILIAALGWGLVHPSYATSIGIVGRAAPGMSIASLDGAEVSFSTFRGTPMVVNFWASWCVPCRQEAPILNAAAKQYNGRVQFVGVDIQDTGSAARSYQSEINSPYPAGPASQGTYLQWGVTAPPETYFINRDGIVVARIIGPVDAGRLEADLRRLAP